MTDSLRGHQIYHDGSQWRYCDTGEPTIDSWRSRPCGHCGLHNTPEGHDGCLGELPDVANACCGHGVAGAAYVQFSDKSMLTGEAAVVWFQSQLAHQADWGE